MVIISTKILLKRSVQPSDSKAKDLINKQPPTMDKHEIDQALDNINQAQNNLNGNKKLFNEQNENRSINKS